VAIAFRAVGALAGADSGNVASIGLPAGHTTDDILLLVANQFDNVASTVSGYTLVASATNGSTCAVRIFAKRDNGAESAPTLTHAAGGVVSCWIAAYSGVPNTLTVGTGAGSIIRDVQNNTGTGNTQTTPALSGLLSGDMRLTLIGQTGSDTSGGATANYSPSVGFTERIDNGRISATTGHAVGTIDDFLSSSSASTTQAGNATGFAPTVSWIGFQLALASSAGVAELGYTKVEPLLPTLRMFQKMGVPFLGFPRPDWTLGGPATIPQTMTATSVVVTASMQRQVGKNLTGTAVAVTASMLKTVGKLMTATTVAVTASMATVKVKLLAMTATAVVVTASMAKQVNKLLTASSVVVTGSMLKQVGKILTATAVVVTATLTTIKVKLLAMTATAVVVTASMTRSVGKLLTASSVAVTASMFKQVGKRLTATSVVLTATLSTIKVKLVAMTATAVVVSASMRRGVATTLTASVIATASIAKQVAHRMSATVAVTGSMVATFGVTVYGGAVSIVNTILAAVGLTDTTGPSVSGSDTLGAGAAASDTSGPDVTVRDVTGGSVSGSDTPP